MSVDAADFHGAICELEASLLSAWISGPSFRGRWTPRHDEFRSQRHGVIARVCVTLHALGTDGDLWPAMLERLHASGDLAKHWPLGQSPLEAARPDDPDAQLAKWVELRALFALHTSLSEVLSRLTLGSALDGFRKAVLEATSKAYLSETAKLYPLGEGFRLAYDSMTATDKRGVGCGCEEIDRATGGLRPGHVWVLGAPTNWGKSSWLLSVADHRLTVASRGVLYVTCEDDPEMLFQRWLVRRAGIRGKAARDARLTTSEVSAAAEQLMWAGGMGPRPVMLDGRGRSVELIARDIRHHVASHGPSLVLVDYLQCINADRVTQDRRAEINHIARTLTDVIKTTGCDGVLASQLTGEDIRESRDVENAAEVVLIGRDTDGTDLRLWLKKNKTGPKGFEAQLVWNAEQGSFETPAPDDFGIPWANE